MTHGIFKSHAKVKSQAWRRQGGTGVNISRNEHTIAAPCEVIGTGYWSGQQVRVVISPAKAGTGIVLVRSDLPGSPACPATVKFRHDAQLRTNLKRGQAQFQLVEHLMAALYAMEIDNCVVEVDGEELPGLDGSSQPFVDALQSAGLIIQAKPKKRLVIMRPITIENGVSCVSASPGPNDSSEFGYQLVFDHPSPIESQRFTFSCTPDRFARQVAPARTFVTMEQAKLLQAQGVASHVTPQDLLIFDTDGPVDNKLRFADECARHKTLDLIGDLALTGMHLVGRFSSHRGGHRLNGKLAGELLRLATETDSDAVLCIDSENQSRFGSHHSRKQSRRAA